MPLNAIRSPGDDFFVHTRTNLPDKNILIIPDISGGWMPGSREALYSRREIIAKTDDSLFEAATDCSFKPGLVLPVANNETYTLPCGSSLEQARAEIRQLVNRAALDGLPDCLNAAGMQHKDLESIHHRLRLHV